MKGPRDEDLIDQDLARARRPVLLPPPANLGLERVGVHWEAKFEGELHFRLDHIVESRDEFSGELTIRLGAGKRRATIVEAVTGLALSACRRTAFN